MISPEILRRFSLFAGIEPSRFNDIAMASEEISLSEGEWLFEEGDPASSLYLLLNGRVELKINLDEKGKRQADLHTMTGGSVIGLSSLVDPHIYTLSAQALSPVKLAKIDAHKMIEMMESDTDFGYTIMIGLSKILTDRLISLRIQFVSLAVDKY
nr:cyclic nucleotide-binding domain-containing protein [Anaerolineae bacterium]